MRRSVWTDERVEAIVARLLRAGVFVAAVIGMIGGILYLYRHGGQTPAYHVFMGEPNEYRSVADMLGDSLAGHGRGLIQLGVLLLIATPVARVALCAFAFSRQHDRLYVGVSLFVLAVLLYSLAVPGPGAG